MRHARTADNEYNIKLNQSFSTHKSRLSLTEFNEFTLFRLIITCGGRGPATGSAFFL